MAKGVKILLLLSFLASLFFAFKVYTRINTNPNFSVGQPLDSLNGVVVYYNGGVNHVEGRNLSKTGYNLGLKYQCVEFVKRYYYEHYQHEMPDSYGHAKDFFDEGVKDGQLNKKRGLTQYTNGSSGKPEVGDLLVFKGHLFNRYGHVAIVSEVSDNEIEIIQQNPGPNEPPREHIPLLNKDGKWTIDNSRVMGWLRMP